MHEGDRLPEAATLYYLQDETMEAIGARLGISRSTVSRMLRQARDQGLVRISLAPAAAAPSALAARVAQRFGVTAHVVPVRDSAAPPTRLDAVAAQAASLLVDWLGDEMSLGVAWGATINAVAERLQLMPKHTHGSDVVQLNGAMNTMTSGVAYAAEILARFGRAFDAQVHYFPVPAFFDYADTRRALWRERSVRRVLDLQAGLDVAIFGVGALQGPVTSHVYASGYLSDADMAGLLRERVVGDVCTVALREDGSYADIALNQRASGPTPAQLAAIPRRLCVVSGAHRVPALLGALRAGAPTDLVIDEQTARALLARDAAGLPGPREVVAPSQGPLPGADATRSTARTVDP